MMSTEKHGDGFAIQRFSPVSGTTQEIHFAIGQLVKVFLGSGVGYSALAEGAIEEVAYETREFRLAGECRWHAWANAYAMDHDNTKGAGLEIEALMTRIQRRLDDGVTTQVYEQLFWARRLADVSGATEQVKSRLYSLQDQLHDLVSARSLAARPVYPVEASRVRTAAPAGDRAMGIAW